MFIIKVAIHCITGVIKIDGNSVKYNIARIIYEYLSKFQINVFALPFKKYTNIFEPSSGGKGNKLNTPKERFICAQTYIIVSRIKLKVDS